MIASSFVSKTVTCSTHLCTEEVMFSGPIHQTSKVLLRYFIITNQHLLLFISLRMNKIENEILICELELNLILVFALQGSKTCHPQISLGHSEYFQLKIIKVPKTQEETLTFPTNCLKNLGRGPFTRIELSPETSAMNMD